LPHPELNDEITYPGHWALMNNAQACPRFSAPLIGEHNEEIYCQRLGYGQDELAAWRRNGII
jgi:crotonobetainyl-CoA:carnitine CoA-transferase CaiB-like acyl-CoA transferase